MNRKRDVIILLAIVSGVSYEDTQKILRKCGMSQLYARNRRDSIFIWALYHGKSRKEVDVLCEKYQCCKISDTVKHEIWN